MQKLKEQYNSSQPTYKTFLKNNNLIINKNKITKIKKYLFQNEILYKTNEEYLIEFTPVKNYSIISEEFIELKNIGLLQKSPTSIHFTFQKYFTNILLGEKLFFNFYINKNIIQKLKKVVLDQPQHLGFLFCYFYFESFFELKKYFRVKRRKFLIKKIAKVRKKSLNNFKKTKLIKEIIRKLIKICQANWGEKKKLKKNFTKIFKNKWKKKLKNEFKKIFKYKWKRIRRQHKRESVYKWRNFVKKERINIRRNNRINTHSFSIGGFLFKDRTSNFDIFKKKIRLYKNRYNNWKKKRRYFKFTREKRLSIIHFKKLRFIRQNLPINQYIENEKKWNNIIFQKSLQYFNKRKNRGNYALINKSKYSNRLFKKKIFKREFNKFVIQKQQWLYWNRHKPFQFSRQAYMNEIKEKFRTIINKNNKFLTKKMKNLFINEMLREIRLNVILNFKLRNIQQKKLRFRSVLRKLQKLNKI